MSVKITAADVKKLRDMTGAGMMDCKKALAESGGDFDGAIEYLRKKGQKMSEKRADREAKEGAVIALTSSNRNNGAVIRLSCETDFVAKTESFVALATTIAEIALKNLPADLAGLLALPYDKELSVSGKIIEQTGVLGEKLEVAEYAKIETAAGEGQVLPYIHMGNRAGVLIALNLEGPNLVEPGRDVAMQVAAMKPIALTAADVPAKVVETELRVGKEKAIVEGKPAEMAEKIAKGRLNKFFKENTLLKQTFVKNSKLSVEAYLQTFDSKLTVTEFKHVRLG
jgi:elongation factor Ts